MTATTVVQREAPTTPLFITVTRNGQMLSPVQCTREPMTIKAVLAAASTTVASGERVMVDGVATSDMDAEVGPNARVDVMPNDQRG